VIGVGDNQAIAKRPAEARGKVLLGMQISQVQFRGMLAAQTDAVPVMQQNILLSPTLIPPRKREKQIHSGEMRLVLRAWVSREAQTSAAFGLIISHGPAFPISDGNLESTPRTLCVCCFDISPPPPLTATYPFSSLMVIFG